MSDLDIESIRTKWAPFTVASKNPNALCIDPVCAQEVVQLCDALDSALSELNKHCKASRGGCCPFCKIHVSPHNGCGLR